jgi:putative transposase
MSRFIILAPGAVVESAGARYVISHILSLESILAKDEATGKIAELKIANLTPSPSASNNKFEVKEVTLIDQEDWAAAERCLDQIRPLLFVRRTKEMVKASALEMGIGLSSLYRKIEVYERTGLVSELIPRRSGGGRGHSRLMAEAEAVIVSTIDEVYLSKQKRSIKKTADEISMRFHNAKLAPPHYNTIRSRIAAIAEKERDKKRLGARAASERHSAYPSHFPGADWPLAVVQIDHTKFDIMLVDDIHRLCIGRPWVTVAIDVFSRMVAGIYVSLDPPSSMSVGLCIAHAILPKEQWLAKLGLSTAWPCWGVMQRIHADNAREFRGHTLQRACKEYGIDLEWRPVKQPRYGAHIERLLGTFNEEIHALPGTTFSNPAERGEYDSESEAVMTLAEFEGWLITYITGVYHQREHSRLSTSPVHQYEKGILGTDDMPGRGLPRRIADEDRLRLDLMPFFERTVQPYGVVLDEVHYYSDVLRRFVNAREPGHPRMKRKFTFRRDPRDISTIYFYDPEVKDYFRIPYRDTARPPMSIWEFREARRRLEKEGVKGINEALVFESYENMRTIEARAKSETKRVRREQQRRRYNERNDKPKTAIEKAISPNHRASADCIVALPIIKPFDELEEL